MEHALSIREIAISDAEAAARLSGELGYPVSSVVMEERIRRLAGLQDHVVFVACLADSLVGWVDVGVVHHLQNDPYAETGGLIVSNGFRSAGIGRKLVLQAEEFAKGRNLTKVVVRSQIAREAAHRFYLREGYERTKTSAVFSKSLSPS
jgi:GNAT superfamily N-acetyltransferase